MDVNGHSVNNRLNHVRDVLNSGNYSEDIDNQADIYSRLNNISMNLLRFGSSNNENEFYFNNIKLNEFLKIFSDEQHIVINSLFAHSSVKEYNELDFSETTTVKALKRIKDQNNSLLINTINFSVDFIQVDISDEYEYIITAINPYFSYFMSEVLKLIKIDDDIWRMIQQNVNKYILINDSKIICTFSSFDEYLQSDYSSIL